MSIFYVSKNGNDSNDGLSWATAKLTISAALSAASSGDDIYIGQGVYYESLSAGNKSFNFYCFNIVILDGKNILNRGIFITSSGTIKWEVKRGLFIIKRFSKGMETTSPANPECINFIFIQNNYGIYSTDGTWRFCLIYKNYYGFYINGSTGGTNCTIAYNMIGIRVEGGNGGFGRCIITSNNNYNFYITSTGTANYCNYNCYDFCNGGKNYKNGVEYTTLESWRSAVNADLNSTDEDPLFVDGANGALLLTGSSPCLDPNKSGSWIIPFRGYNGNIGFGFSKAITGNTWDDGIFDNTETDGNGNLCLSEGQTIGTWASPVIDMTLKRRLLKFSYHLENENFDNFPNIKIDKDNTSPESNNMPNRAQLEVRTASSLFNKTDPSPEWRIVNAGEEIKIMGRYVQFRVTLRNNGVA